MPEANISAPTEEETTGDGAAEVTRDEEPGSAPGAEGDQGEQLDQGDQGEGDARTGLTPRQARRVRIVLSGVVMVAVAVALVVRLGSAPSVLTVGFYGIALILSGTAIVLSRRGRTRVATGVLVLGFGAVALAEWLLASVQ
ncbi:hypothetical protein [Streptomyces sp. WMMB 322]|uniref:hypothetical protein n=1 Tax=Streptomyces sp. WMMB 322 TaxID=1286821 RepID=UPI0006E396F7|nr:hypothetical protein [Streptomyces sp. WMMB 322]SCK36367.1 hypothetical protein H180DRAFT_03042 [Streptomyces sp. WMMB 322]